jgi:hypothetical protein
MILGAAFGSFFWLKALYNPAWGIALRFLQMRHEAATREG